MPISATTDFNSGGGVYLTVDDASNHIDMELHDSQSGDRYDYFLFRLDGAAGETVSFTITNHGDDHRISEDYHVLYTADIANHDWHRFDDSIGSGFTRTFGSDEVYISMFQAYPLNIVEDRVAQLATNEYVETEVIGQSGEGRDMHVIRLTDPTVPDSEKKDVIGTTRQHPGEVVGSYQLDSILDTILDIFDNWTKSLAEEYIFHFIPLANPDGAYEGWHRYDPDGNDFNRQWDTETPTEVGVMKDYFRQNTSDVVFGWDLHGATNEGSEAVWAYDAVSDDPVFQEIESHSLSASGIQNVTDDGYMISWVYNEFGAPAALTEAYQYYPYTVEELREEGENFFLESVVLNEVTGQGQLRQNGEWQSAL